MKYKSLVNFNHDELGQIKKGEEVDATEVQAVTPLALGYFETYKTKVINEKPESGKSK